MKIKDLPNFPKEKEYLPIDEAMIINNPILTIKNGQENYKIEAYNQALQELGEIEIGVSKVSIDEIKKIIDKVALEGRDLEEYGLNSEEIAEAIMDYVNGKRENVTQA